MMLRGPPQCGQVSTSSAKTRRSNSAQVERERAEALGAAGELGASGPQGCELGAGARLGTTRSRQAEVLVELRRIRELEPLLLRARGPHATARHLQCRQFHYPTDLPPRRGSQRERRDLRAARIEYEPEQVAAEHRRHRLANRQPFFALPQRHQQLERRHQEVPAAAARVEHLQFLRTRRPVRKNARRRAPRLDLLDFAPFAPWRDRAERARLWTKCATDISAGEQPPLKDKFQATLQMTLLGNALLSKLWEPHRYHVLPFPGGRGAGEIIDLYPGATLRTMGLASYKSKPDEAVRLGIAACTAAGIKLGVDLRLVAFACRYSSDTTKSPNYDVAGAFVAFCTAILHAENGCRPVLAPDPTWQERLVKEREGAFWVPTITTNAPAYAAATVHREAQAAPQEEAHRRVQGVRLRAARRPATRHLRRRYRRVRRPADCGRRSTAARFRRWRRA